ncbi:MAG: PD40 domain-containing protein [Acidobacteria bacterium]|nr:PD40 domain-containing protein [Acidobacteriota bacterium]
MYVRPRLRVRGGPAVVHAIDGGRRFVGVYESATRSGGPIWSPDGKWIAFGNSATPEELARGGRPAPPPADGRETDVR